MADFFLIKRGENKQRALLNLILTTVSFLMEKLEMRKTQMKGFEISA